MFVTLASTSRARFELMISSKDDSLMLPMIHSSADPLQSRDIATIDKEEIHAGSARRAIR